MAAVWVVKAGERGEREQRDLEHGVVAIGWEEMDDLSRLTTREEVKDVYRKTYRDAPEGRVRSHSGQIWTFLRKIAIGDLVVTPIKTRSEIAVGTIKSDYQFTQQFGPDMQHTRCVEWIRTDIPRTKFDQDLLYSFGAFMTVCQVTRERAEERIRAVIAGRALPVADEAPTEAAAPLDLQEVALDEIARYIDQKFKGHALARLVDGVLQAQGYVTRLSEPGPDGGVDILCGQGPIGLDPPRICVQVKSSNSRLDVDVYRALKGTMDTFQAEQGLLVGWGGFTAPARKEAETSYFRVRLWDSADLIEAVLRYYDHLPDDLQAKLPLERIWRLAPSPEDEA